MAKAAPRRKAASRKTSAKASRGKAAGPRKAIRPLLSATGTGRGTHAVASRRIGRVERRLEETPTTPPSSLGMDRHGSAARTGQAEMAERLREHPGITPAITGGDVDANWEEAYFSGDEAPGGDNPTPDQDVVDDIGKALGVEYHDNEELKASEKLVERDKHRWELDPASSEDYKDRK